MSYLGSNLQTGDPTRTIAQPLDADRFSGNASSLSFTLSRRVGYPTDLEVFVENIQQEPITAYTVNGTTLTFTEAPPTGTLNVYAVYKQSTNNTQVTLADGSVTYSKLANNIRLFTSDNLTPNGNNSVFTLSEPPADANTVFVTVDGVVQRAPVHYTTSGTTITFTSAPPALSNVHVRHLGFRTSTTVTAIPVGTYIPQPNIATPTITSPTITSPTITGGLSVTGNPTFTNAFDKIFSITASNASNTLIVSLSSCALDFRSTTVTTGTVTTVTGTPASLTIPTNQSWGIATTTVSNRYVILCFNNAGTLALGVTPLQNGVQLDETNLLSPTSTANNTPGVIYSTISASNLAYRVVGFIDAVYVNGTGYTTAPTLVQGYGGQALSAMSSLGYGQTWQAVTRAAGTTYYNTTGKPILWRYSFTSAGSGQAVGTVTVSGISYADNWQVTAGYTIGTVVTIPPGGSYSFSIGGAAGGSAGQSYELR